jgi:hypothetical protein
MHPQSSIAEHAIAVASQPTSLLLPIHLGLRHMALQSNQTIKHVPSIGVAVAQKTARVCAVDFHKCVWSATS